MLDLRFDEIEVKQIKALSRLQERMDEGIATDSEFRAWEILSHAISRRIAEKMKDIPWD